MGGEGVVGAAGEGGQRPLFSDIFTTRLLSRHRIPSRPRRQNTFLATANDPNVPIFGASVNQPRAPLLRVVWSCLGQFCGPQPSFFASPLANSLVTALYLVAASNLKSRNHPLLRHPSIWQTPSCRASHPLLLHSDSAASPGLFLSRGFPATLFGNRLISLSGPYQGSFC